MTKPIVLVNEKDKVLGLKEKFATHKIPVPLHRAVSILILNKDKTKMLITRRANTKPTWGGVWSNAVCSHPFPDETYQKAAERRLFEELGFKTPITEVFNFIYEAKMKEGVWGECELDHVFVGFYENRFEANPEEVEECKWVEIEDLKKDIKNNPEKYTPWFKMILDKI